MRCQMLSRAHDERGAILIQVGVVMIGLLAFAALVHGLRHPVGRAAPGAERGRRRGARRRISLEHNPDYDVARASAKAVGETQQDLRGRSHHQSGKRRQR